jgi:hypothetical protein
MEDTMPKHLPICAALVVFAVGTAHAHEREATLQRFVVPGAGFDIAVATEKDPGGPLYDLSESPDALLLHLPGGELALPFEDAETMLKTIQSMRSAVSAFHVSSSDAKSRRPFAIYVLPKDE